MFIRFNSSVPLEYDPYEIPIVDISGSVVVVDDYNEYHIGSIWLYSVDREAIINSGLEDFYVVMDAISNSLSEIANDFYNDDNEFKDKVLGDDYVGYHSLIHLEKIEIYKEFRGFGIGHVVLDRAIHLFGRGSEIVTVKPYPLQFSNKELSVKEKESYSDLEQNRTIAEKKLKNMYKKWGFKKLKGSDYFYQQISNWIESHDQPFDLPDIDNEEELLQKLIKRVGLKGNPY